MTEWFLREKEYLIKLTQRSIVQVVPSFDIYSHWEIIKDGVKMSEKTQFIAHSYLMQKMDGTATPFFDANLRHHKLQEIEYYIFKFLVCVSFFFCVLNRNKQIKLYKPTPHIYKTQGNSDTIFRLCA